MYIVSGTQKAHINICQCYHDSYRRVEQWVWLLQGSPVPWVTHGKFSGASLVSQTVNNLPAMQETQVQSRVGKIPRRRGWLPSPVFLLWEFHGQRNLAGYSPWGRKESDTTDRLTLSSSQSVFVKSMSEWIKCRQLNLTCFYLWKRVKLLLVSQKLQYYYLKHSHCINTYKHIIILHWACMKLQINSMQMPWNFCNKGSRKFSPDS